MFDIEKGIEIPENRGNGGGRKRKYPFFDMEVWDSFFTDQAGDRKGNPPVRFAASYYARRHPGFYFTIRKVEGGYRIWRVTAEFAGKEG